MDLPPEYVPDPVVSERARVTAELIELAEQMMRQNLKRRHPDASHEEIERRLDDWYSKKDQPIPDYCRPVHGFGYKP